MAGGVFISFEGTEGCGKSTQVQRIKNRLEQAGVAVLVTREPGGTAIGESIRQLLQFTPHAFGMTAETELLLFEASRAQLVREIINPALERGTTVISDRFYDSTTVYQGAARKLDRKLVDQLNRFAVNDCRPDITFVLDIDLPAARRRLIQTNRPADRMEQQPDEFYDAVRAGYRELVKAEPDRVVLIDGSKSRDALEAEIWDVIASRLPALAKIEDRKSKVENPQS